MAKSEAKTRGFGEADPGLKLKVHDDGDIVQGTCGRKKETLCSHLCCNPRKGIRAELTVKSIIIHVYHFMAQKTVPTVTFSSPQSSLRGGQGPRERT